MKNKSKVLALKYRPLTFDQLIGQDVIAETIYNSIKSKKSANAYLFTGIRGVGKTTIARIVAKSLNCEKGIDNICKENFCTHCESITNSNHLDVLEMDAASKTGVDDVRDLIEFSRYGPTSAKYKIFIIDEVHMLSKQAFNALLKTLEEPPEYLKFIFATTEIKKIPVTVVSRCQRYDLSRVKSDQLFQFIKKIKDKENGKVSDDALKLIVKISEGSVRDALSLLDRGLMSNSGEELDLKNAQKIYGYFDKSSLITLFENILEGKEDRVIEIYRKIYDSGIEPKTFLNDFLEILYYFKNISSIKQDGTNFALNDDDFYRITEISNKIESSHLLLFWQFTIKTIDELNIVLNQNLSVEMFLIRLIYLKDFRKKKIIDSPIKKNTLDNMPNDEKKKSNMKTVDQIKNITQQDKELPKIKPQDVTSNLRIMYFEDLIEICNKKKELKLKYELETNVNLVNFDEGRMEIAFNDNLDNNFIKDLSNKLYEWTNKRWIISLSKRQGIISKKQQMKIDKEKLFEEAKKSKIYKKVLENLPDAELIDLKIVEDKDDGF